MRSMTQSLGILAYQTRRSTATTLPRMVIFSARIGQDRHVAVRFDRGGWSPALFADIAEAGFGLLTYRKRPAPDLPAAAFTAITCADDRGREHQYDLADTTAALSVKLS
jgi:hypothetical protein